MESEYSIPLQSIIEEFQLEVLHLPECECLITNTEVNRPGLALAGFFENFEPSRVEIIGLAEQHYLDSFPDDVRDGKMREFMSHRPACVILSTGIEAREETKASARAFGVPLLSTKERTSPMMAALIASLNTHLGPRITRHGVLVEVYGEGVLILGDSGVGKSETAIELVKR